MGTVHQASQARFVLTPIATCLLAALPLVAPDLAARTSAATSAASTLVVSNCDDAGPGSLRETIASQAVSGDMIDLTQLACSTITLSSGSIAVPQDDLVLLGPGSTALTIDAGSQQGYQNHLLTHTGGGTVEISGVALTNANPTGPHGGCINSAGSVFLLDVSLSGCVVTASGAEDAKGGAVYAVGNVTLKDSIVRDNRAISLGSGVARGGGIYARGDANVSGSIIDSNNATSFETAGVGGGIFVPGPLTMTGSQVLGNRASNPFLQNGQSDAGGLYAQSFIIFRSTIANNFAGVGGAIRSNSTTPSISRVIVNSTISSNQSLFPPAGIFMLGSLELDNSTVVFNQTASTAGNNAAGILSYGDVTMQSSIVAGNSVQGQAADISASGSVTGADNLIYQPVNTAIPADTLVGVDPLLGALANHGGATQTHAVLDGSPVLDAGNNNIGFEYDQRLFARTVGAGTDIGAFESRPTVLAITPDTVDFGGVPVGVTSPPVVITVANAGDGDLQVDFVGAPSLPFTRSGGSCDPTPFTLVANASCTMEINFAPESAGNATQTLDIFSDAGDGALVLSGNGVANDLIFQANFDP